ncbi:histidine kinase [Flavobacteriaceae bacterium S356]|uniref:Histidine kinase n=1 Tax=Asprobacillus argus TaxID=3076534 RepID=A0ABU3LE76_9FLAO|nr:histidine kinase [Flavobacteriaceae bacterium S356]
MEDSIGAVADFVLGQTLFDASIVYINLFILIPLLLSKYGKFVYILGVTLTLLIISFLVEFVGLYGLLSDLNNEFNNSPNLGIYNKLFSYFIEFGLFMIISFLYWYFTKHREEQQKALHLLNEKLQTELQVLRSQVSPQFLFESLKNIHALSLKSDTNASVMIEKLSDILRHIIYEGRQKETLLKEEIGMIENYIQLQILRKSKNERSIRYQISGDFSNKKVAPLLLLYIVENSFKHCELSSTEDDFLEIDISMKNNVLHLKTKNTFIPNSNEKGKGLENLKEQLEHIYTDKNILKIDAKDGIFSIELSLEIS